MPFVYESVESSTANSVSKFNNRHFHDRHFLSSFSRYIIMRRLHFLKYFATSNFGLTNENRSQATPCLGLIRCGKSGDPTSKRGGNDDKLYRVMS